MGILINLGIVLLNIIYLFIKLFPTKNKITFISREKNEPSLDFKLLSEAIKKKNASIEIVILCKRLDPGIRNRITYVFHMFRQMYHIATSKVVILDTYCICISVLKHKKRLKVVQMWHAMGSLKKFGYSILDQKEGSNSQIAKWMHMHENYDYVFTSSEQCLKNFAEAFNVSVDKMVVMPPPKVDLIIDAKRIKDNRERVLKKYPILKKKKNILYCPTFRKNTGMRRDIQKLIDEVDFKKYNLVIKLHPLSKTVIDDKRIIFDRDFSTIEVAAACDYVITDYSAVVFEIALLNKPLFFYAYDRQTYVNNRDFYMNYDEMPGVISDNPKVIVEAIENKKYDLKKVKKFALENVKPQKNGYTNSVVKFILNIMK